VLFGACDDLLIPQPLGPFWDMARLEPTLKEPLDDGDRPRLLETVLDLLSRSLRPSVMVIEDTHWADEATFDAIKYLGRRIARTNGLLLLTYRDGEVDYDHPLRGVIGDLPTQSVVRIQLGGLSRSAVVSIISESSLDPDEVMTATNGNPFLVTEMASVDGDVVPSSLQDSVMARVRKLSIGAHEMLKMLSVIPEPIPRLDALGITGVDESRLDECERRGLLNIDSEMVGFRHDLIRRAIESALTGSERVAKHRMVLDDLPEETHSSLLIHCAVEANDIDRLIDLAPRSARYAAAMGSHVQAVADFRELEPYLGRLTPEALGPYLDDWAREELLVDNVLEAIRLSEIAVRHYRELGEPRAESRALAQAAHFYENAGQRGRAEERAREAVDVLGADPNGADLATALEVKAYLQTMAGNVSAVPELVDRTLEAGGPNIDERIFVRSLNHRGIVANIANYPEGRRSLDEAARRAETTGQWYEESRALMNHAWAAAEFRDLPIASDYIQRSIASAVRHELPTLEAYSNSMYARISELEGDWGTAEDLTTDLLDSMAISLMVALPIMGVIAARRGRETARSTLIKAWEMAVIADENQRLAPAAAAFAEYAWISGHTEVPVSEFKNVMRTGINKGFQYSPGSIAFWLWKLGELSDAPEGIAKPYRLVIEGKTAEAAAIWEAKGIPYDRALALMHGDQASRLEALEIFETLGATAVAAKLRKTLRDEGVSVPRGKGRKTRGHAAGLTARQAEVLELLDEGLSNIEIADRLFLSPRTAEHHVAAVISKFAVSTRDEAVKTATEQGFLPTSGPS
ncbi:MAG: LuxR C-terminal-related transcriptional regulator, partial [Actinobacteria bacterium]|nr:LuxR C-terminal-related transcriptional regulator [Actinomycetota bacterium]